MVANMSALQLAKRALMTLLLALARKRKRRGRGRRRRRRRRKIMDRQSQGRQP